MTKPLGRVRVALHLPSKPEELVVVARLIVERMAGHPFFPTTTPPLATVTAAIDDLDAAQVAVLTRRKGTPVTRDEKRRTLVGLLQGLKACVQLVADANPAQAASIIESTGMSVEEARTLPARGFAARPGKRKGTVSLSVPSAGDRAAYQWARSLDGGATWQDAPPTRQASTVLEGLPSGATCLFRFRAIVVKGATDWSQPQECMVP